MKENVFPGSATGFADSHPTTSSFDSYCRSDAVGYEGSAATISDFTAALEVLRQFEAGETRGDTGRHAEKRGETGSDRDEG
jgi:hypothetical protein